MKGNEEESVYEYAMRRSAEIKCEAYRGSDTRVTESDLQKLQDIYDEVVKIGIRTKEIQQRLDDLLRS